MIERGIHFYSDGYRLEGTLYFPDDLREGEKRPAVLPLSGYQGFNQFYPRLFAEYLTKSGFVCLGFDYRGFARSEGPPDRVVLDEQVEDAKNAVTFLRLQKEADPERIGILGWGMGASHAIRVAARDTRVRAVAALNGFYNGKRWLKSIHSYVEWNRLIQEVERDRASRVNRGRSTPVDPFIHYPLDPDTEDVVRKELKPLPFFGKRITLQLTESILEMDAEKEAKNIAPRPLFIAHGKRNMLHPPEEAQSLYEAAKEPKELYWIDGKHNDFMHRGDPAFEDLMERLTGFFGRNLQGLRRAERPPLLNSGA